MSWCTYVFFMEKIYFRQTKIHSVKFRDKKYTWRKRYITINGKDMGDETKNHFYYFRKENNNNKKSF